MNDDNDELKECLEDGGSIAGRILENEKKLMDADWLIEELVAGAYELGLGVGETWKDTRTKMQTLKSAREKLQSFILDLVFPEETVSKKHDREWWEVL